MADASIPCLITTRTSKLFGMSLICKLSQWFIYNYAWRLLPFINRLKRFKRLRACFMFIVKSFGKSHAVYFKKKYEVDYFHEVAN